MKATNEIKKTIGYACRAPSGHNTQPWKFQISEIDDSIKIFPDFGRKLSVVDGDNHALFIGLGCCLENLIIAAENFGFKTKVKYSLSEKNREFIQINLLRENKKIKANNPLFESIMKRQSNRRKYESKKIPIKDLNKLKDASKSLEAKAIFFLKDNEIKNLLKFVREGSILQYGDKKFVNELISWMRFSKKSAEKHNDGLYSAVMAIPRMPEWLGKIILKFSAKPKSMAKNFEKLAANSSGLVLFVSKNNNKKSWIETGRCFERFVLTATSLGISNSHVNMPCEVLSIRKKLEKELNLQGYHALLLVRIGYGKPMPYSLRRSLSEVVVN